MSWWRLYWPWIVVFLLVLLGCAGMTVATAHHVPVCPVSTLQWCVAVLHPPTPD